MSRGAQSFKQGDLTRAVKGVVKAGVQVGRVEITANKITVFAGGPETSETVDASSTDENEWDSVQ